MSVLGQALGTDVFMGALHAVLTPGLPVRCCFGTVEEREAAFEMLDSATEVVLDGTALCTLYVLNLLGALRGTTKRWLIPHSLMTVFRTFVQSARTKERATAGMSATEEGTALHIYTEAEKVSGRERAEAFKTQLMEIVIVAPSTEVASMIGSLRQKLTQAMDDSTLDSVAVSSTPGRILWTDDMVIGHLARTEVGSSSVWTQGVLLWLLQRGLLSEMDYTQASAKLSAFEYSFTSVSPAVLAEVARMAEWGAARWPLAQAVAQLGMTEVRPADAAHLGALLVRDAFAEPLDLGKRQAILFGVCAALSARTDGRMEGFERTLPRIFGLNMIGQAQAALALRAWKRPPPLVEPRSRSEPGTD